MKHGRVRTTCSKPDWYRRWEQTQVEETHIVMFRARDGCGFDRAIVSEMVLQELRSLAKDGAQSVVRPLSGVEVTLDPTLPWVKSRNREYRRQMKRVAWHRERERRENEERRSRKPLDAVNLTVPFLSTSLVDELMRIETPYRIFAGLVWQQRRRTAQRCRIRAIERNFHGLPDQ